MSIKIAFEQILNDTERMKKYNECPIMKATLLGLYEYVCAGNKLEKLPWFALTKFARKQEQHVGGI